MKRKNNRKLLLLSVIISCLVVLSACSPYKKDKAKGSNVIGSAFNSQIDIIETTMPQATTTTTPQATTKPPAKTTTKPAEKPPSVSNTPVNTDILNYYNLTEVQRLACIKLADAMKNHVAKVNFDKPITNADIKAVYNIVKNMVYYCSDIPLQYTIYSSQSTGLINSVELHYNLSATQSNQMTSALISKVSQIKAKVPTTSQFDKIKYIHDYIINNCQYASSLNNNNIFTAYGALVEGNAVCEGYSKAFAILCNEVGIDCYLMTGDGVTSSGSTPHMWNLVKCDGQWYHMDVTWDDPTGGTPTLSYAYFNVTAAQIQTDHRIDTDTLVKLNSATATQSNFFVKYGYQADSYDSAKTIIQKQAKAGQKTIYVKAINQTVFNTIDSDIIKSGRIYTILNDVGVKTSNVQYSYTGYICTINLP